MVTSYFECPLIFLSMSSRMSNLTRFSLLVSFPNTDPLKYHAELISECFKRAVMSSVFGLVTSSTSFSPLPFCLITDLFLITRAFMLVLATLTIMGRGFPFIPGILWAATISRSSRPTLMVDFRRSCTSFHVFSLSFSLPYPNI